MDKRKFFLAALKANAYRRRDWVLRAYSVTRHKPINTLDKASIRHYDIHLASEQDTRLHFVDPEKVFLNPNAKASDWLTVIDDSDKTQPLLGVNERLTLFDGDLPNVFTDIYTTYGTALANMYLLVYPFKSKIAYMNFRQNGSEVEDKIAELLVADPPQGESRRPDKIYVDEYLSFCDSASALAGFASICAPSASMKSLTVDPSVIKLRDELLEQYKDKLHDIAYISLIQGKLAAADKATFKGDSAEGFYIKSKAFDIARMKALIMHGVEVGFGEASDDSKLIRTSLAEGWNVHKMSVMVDSLRAGSYNRGHQTALGGESVKYFYRVFQNVRLGMDDCKSISGLWWDVNKYTMKEFPGRYMVVNGTSETVQITKENVKEVLAGRTSVQIRSPMICQSEGSTYCKKCLGDKLAISPNSIYVQVSDIGSTFMYTFMKLMHGIVLSTARYEPEYAIF